MLTNLTNLEVSQKLDAHASMLRTILSTEGFNAKLPTAWVEAWTALKCEAASRGLK